MLKKRLIILTIAVILSITAISAAVITAIPAAGISDSEEKSVYRLAAYKDNVALYKNGEPICVYEEIVLNSLPEYDRELFKRGMEIENLEVLEEILQDYEG